MTCENCKRLERDCNALAREIVDTAVRDGIAIRELRVRVADLERENFQLHVIARGRSSSWLAALRRWFIGWRAGK